MQKLAPREDSEKCSVGLKNILFFGVECRRNHSFFNGERRDCSHPIRRSGCGSCTGERMGGKKIRQKNCVVCLDKGELKANTIASQRTFLHSLAGQSCISHFALGAMSLSNPFSLVAEEATTPISSA
ncbi:unnamed protein product [Dovyalis caffra]|uniref:Uncharacterized protein n=1 Tax=Dovyalis caffra TaxID=77055 RepID=A0AAV1QZE6_9ROSI|nr:unnamed protein product [Dovyalis caffra]